MKQAAALSRLLLLSAGALVMLLPFADMLIGALRSPSELLARPPPYWPQDPQWSNYLRVFHELPMALWGFNSLVVTTAITLLQLLTSAMAGFALAKYRFPGRRLIFRTVLAAQIFPFFLLVIPIFVIIRYWPLAGGNDLFGQGGTGLLGSYAALILPFSVSWYGVFLMRQFMAGVPDDLLDAARIDGASEARILFTIVMPLLRPALTTLGIFVFIFHWNEVIWTMTITQSAPELQTAPVGIYLLRGAFVDAQAQSLQQAAVVVTILPMLALFLALQRYYVRGLATTGLK